jgi:hypothetical protein
MVVVSWLLGAYLQLFKVSKLELTNNGDPPITLVSLMCPSAATVTSTFTVPVNPSRLAN